MANKINISCPNNIPRVNINFTTGISVSHIPNVIIIIKNYKYKFCLFVAAQSLIMKYSNTIILCVFIYLSRLIREPRNICRLVCRVCR